MDPELVLLAGPEGLAFAQLDLVLQKGGSLFLEKEKNWLMTHFAKVFILRIPKNILRVFSPLIPTAKQLFFEVLNDYSSKFNQYTFKI